MTCCGKALPLHATTGYNTVRKKRVTIEHDIAVVNLRDKKEEDFIVTQNNVPEVNTSKVAEPKQRLRSIQQTCSCRLCVR
jgi:hypothetical protein